VTSASAPAGQGLAGVVANLVQFDPGSDFDHLAEGESAEVVINYAIEDEHGAVANSTLTVTVTGTNDGPVANADTAVTDEDSSVLIDVLANDTDADEGAVLTVTAASAPAGQGTASVETNQVAFDPGTDFDYLGVGETASVEVSYTIEDEHGATSSSTVSITVTGTNDTPVANAASASVAEDGLFNGSVTATDADGDAVSFSLLDPAPEGLTFNSDGTYSIDAASYDWLYAGQTATYLLAFTATDTEGATSAPAILSITITGTNDVPVVDGEILDQSVSEETLWTFTVPAGTFTDPDSVLLYSATLGDGSDLPSWLSFDPDSQTFNGTPPAEFSGTISLKVTATDGLASESDTFDLTVAPVNDAPVNTIPATFSTNEDTALALNGLQVADADAGSGTISVQLSVDGGWLTAASAGGVTVTGSGTASLTLSGTLAAINAYLATAGSQPVFNGNASGPVNLTMITNDGGNSGGSAAADTDTSVITVVAVNDAPVNSVPGAQSVQAGVATDIDTFGAWVSDVDSPTLTSTLSVGNGTLSVATGTGATVAGNGSGTVTLSGTQAQINAALDALRYTSASGFSGTDTLTLATTDGALTDTDQVSIQVNGAQAVNIKFVPNGNDYGNSLPGGEVFGTFVAYDANGNAIPGATITSSIVAGGDLSFNNGQLAGDLGNGDVFTFTVTSGSVTETVTIRVGNGSTNPFTGNANIDIMFGVNGGDPLAGGDNDDALYGNEAGDTLSGGENDDFLIGGNADDTLGGGNGNDYLRGGLGQDTLIGGAGVDLFVFNVAPGATDRDTITDFNASGDPLNGDRILLDDGIFSAFGSTVDAGEFRASVGGTALDGNDYLLFDTTTGSLYYDADGNGAGARQLIAVVTVTSGTIDPADFLMI
jgi:VCBS repeat-containing protein